ncbi:MAG: DUF342 domain-containing protein, partial [Clostridiales bacterium]|nr:DUF342 domain-containing protein [Clostridiales bacterium]
SDGVSTENLPDPAESSQERISLQVSGDEMTATILFNLNPEELSKPNRERLIREVFSQFALKGVIYGIKKEILNGELEAGKVYIIAEGTPAVDGVDSIIRMYEIQSNQPEVRDDGKVDFYELKLINRVHTDEWLGERLDATDGTPGKTVTGKVVSQIRGKTLQLSYDKNSIKEVPEPGKTVLYSSFNGAVSYTGGKISVSNHLEIPGDVNFNTGNIKFDGYLTIKGTVGDGFSVEAVKDVEINSETGLGSVKSIISTAGSVFIKGGILPKGRVEISAAKNVYIKFVDNADIKCGGIAHIGYYCMNSNISAREVIMDSSNGHIIGGHIIADVKVHSPIIGSEAERKTTVEVRCFNRPEMIESLNHIFHRISELKNEQQKIKTQIAAAGDTALLDQYHKKEYNNAVERLYTIKEDIKQMEDERKNISEYLKAHGDGEISSTRIYPKSTLILCNHVVEANTVMSASTFYYQDGEVKQL